MFEFRGKIFKLSRVWKKGMNGYIWVYIPLMPTDEWTAQDLHPEIMMIIDWNQTP